MIHAYFINCGFCLTIPICKNQLLFRFSFFSSLTMLPSLPLWHVILTIYFCLLLWFHQEKLKDKDTQIVEIRKLLSERQDIILKWEQDLSKCNLDLNEREKRINDIFLVEVHFSLVISLVVSWKLQTRDLLCPPFSSLLLLKCAG